MLLLVMLCLKHKIQDRLHPPASVSTPPSTPSSVHSTPCIWHAREPCPSICSACLSRRVTSCLHLVVPIAASRVRSNDHPAASTRQKKCQSGLTDWHWAMPGFFFAAP